MTNLTDLFDEYALRARVYPGLLACLPLIVFILTLWPGLGLNSLWAAIAAAGGTFFLANYVRSLGKRLERALIRDWDGLPTTHLLRHREVDNQVMFRRRRAALEQVFGEPLPTVAEEDADHAAADQVYVAATRALIAKVRSQKDVYPRVHEENINYGYRRNLLAVKPLGLSLLGLVAAADVSLLVMHPEPLRWIALILDIVIGLAWLFIVRKQWVKEQADTYAERLFEVLEEGTLLAPPP